MKSPAARSAAESSGPSSTACSSPYRTRTPPPSRSTRSRSANCSGPPRAIRSKPTSKSVIRSRLPSSHQHENVRAGAAGQDIMPRPRRASVSAPLPPEEPVSPLPPGEKVVSTSATQNVIPVTALQHVTALPPDQPVVPAHPVQGLRPLVTGKTIVAVTADHGFKTGSDIDRPPRRGARCPRRDRPCCPSAARMRSGCPRRRFDPTSRAVCPKPAPTKTSNSSVIT